MESAKITVIIAVYNTEKYLHKCIESIVNQTYTNLEIILINDGSKDSSAAICDDFAKSDKRIKVLHKTNGGQGSARNKALDIATGDWIGFVDSDDWIDSDMYESLVTRAISEQAEIVECGWKKISENGNIEFTTPPKHITIDREQAMHALIYAKGEGINTSVCNKIFKKDIINSIRFPEVRAYEDDEWIHKIVWSASKIVITGTPKYYYFSRGNSTMTSKFNLDKLALLTVQSNICEFLQKNAPHHFNKAQKTLCSKQFYMISCLLKNPELDKEKEMIFQIEQNILNFYHSFMKNPIMGRNKLVLWLYRFFPRMARVAIKLMS